MAKKPVAIDPGLMSSLVSRVARARAVFAASMNLRLESAGIDMNAERVQLLFVIGFASDINQKELAEEVGSEKTTVSRQIDGLVTAGLVERAASPRSRREHRLALTRKGRAMIEKLLPLSAAMVRTAQEGVESEDLVTCMHVLDRMIENLSGRSEWGQAGVLKLPGDGR